MAKHGLLGFLPEILGGLALGATGLGAAGIGPLAGVFGGAEAGADVGAAAGADLAGGTAADAAAAAAPLAVGTEAAGAAAPGAFLIPGTDTALSAGGLAAGDLSGLTAAAVGTGTDALAAGAAPLTASLDQAGGVLGALGPSGPAGPAGATADLTGGAGLTAGGAAAPTSPIAAAAGQPVSSAVAAASPDTFFVPGTDTALSSVAGAPAYPTIATGSLDTSAAGGGGGISGGIGDAFSKIGEVTSNPIFKGITGLANLGLLGSQLLRGPQSYPEQTALQGQAAQNLNLANTLQQPLTTGALPTGDQSFVDLATAAKKAQITTAFANAGLSGSTMEAEQLGQVDSEKAAQQAQIAQGLFSSALPYSSLGTSTTQGLLQTAMTEDEQYRQALANFAKALGGVGGTSPQTYQLTPTA